MSMQVLSLVGQENEGEVLTAIVWHIPEDKAVELAREMTARFGEPVASGLATEEMADSVPGTPGLILDFGEEEINGR